MGVIKQAAALAALCCGLLFAQSAPQWHNLYPSYTGLAFGDGKFVAVSSDGLIKTTGNGGESWSQKFANQRLSSAAYGDGMFVVTQEPNGRLYSLNGGGSWETGGRDGNYPCRYLIFGKERFIGIGEAGRTFLYYQYQDENDETSWQWKSITAEDSHSDNLLHAAFGNNIFVAVGSNIVSSPNGDGWGVRHSGFTGTMSLVAYGNDKFAALSSQGGLAYTSDNGVDWISQPSPTLPAGMADIAFYGGKFVAVGNAGAAITSADGINWTQSTGLNPNDNFKAVKYGEGAGFMALGAGGSVYTSPDGGTWTKKAAGRIMSYKEIVSGGGKYVAVGDSGASFSADGRDWSRGTASEGKFAGLQRVAFGAGKFVAAGDSGALFVSTDGAAWENASRNNQMMFTGVAFGNDMFVVVGYMGTTTNATACVITYEEATGWKEATNINSPSGWPSMYPISIGFGSGIFLAGSSSGVLRSSINGIYWSNETPPAAPPGTSYRYRSITYVNDRFVAVGATSGGDNFTIIMSSNGTTWATIPAPRDMAVRAVTFAKSYYYIAVGDSGKIMASPNGQEWSTQSLATNKNLQTIYTADGNTILAGGADGALLYSTDNPISVRYAQNHRVASVRSFRMSLEKTGKTLLVSLSFTPKTAGTIAVYSLTGKQLYRKNIIAGERRVPLSGRAASASSGSVIVKYTGDGGTVVQRFQITK
jgi:hypothetical protein